MRPSMGSVGDGYDNAMCESFFATLECELLARRQFIPQVEARMAVFSYIEGWYNPARRHSGIQRGSPLTRRLWKFIPLTAVPLQRPVPVEYPIWWRDELAAGGSRIRPTERKNCERLHRRDQLVPVQQIADAFLTLLVFLAAARSWIALMVSFDQNL